MRVIGSVIHWSREKGWGFAEVTTPVEGQPGLEERDVVFLHHSDLGGKIPHIGDLITFITERSSNLKHPWRGKQVVIVRKAESINPAVEAVR